MASIAIVLPDLRGGGAERVGLTLGKAFLAHGHAVAFVLMKAQGELLGMVPKDAAVVDLEAARLRRALLPLARYLRDARPDALLASMWPLTSIAVWARGLARVPTRVVVSDHNDLRTAPPGRSALGRLKMKGTMRWSYPRADGVVAVSAGVGRSVAALANLPPHRVSVIHNPIAPPKDDATIADACAAPGWASHKGPKVIAIGTLKEQKGFPLLLSAFVNVRQLADARLLVLGEGPLRGELEALRSRLGLDGAVDMPGFVADPYPYLAKADVFVLSSAWEGFGNVIVEALACGTKVVSTDCPSGPREILEDGRYGKLVPVGDAGALAQAILAALDEDHDRAALIRRSQDFSVEKAADEYLRLLLPESVS
jgi:glycosyltransferase involved in cell wall biosynthesis